MIDRGHPRLLQEWVALRAEFSPAAAAITMGGTRLTYGQLEARSNQVARALRDSGAHPGDRVCLIMPKSPTAIVGIIGALKADCAYVPLDVTSPAPRLARMLRSCDPAVALVAPSTGAIARELAQTIGHEAFPSVGWMDAKGSAPEDLMPTFTMEDVSAAADGPVPWSGDADDAAYILFTSGSTGEPKGVVITHANVIHFVRWANRQFGVTSQDRMSGHAPLHFDLSTYDIHGSFAAGAELYPVPPELNLLPGRLAEFIRSTRLTRWFSAPSILNYMAKFDVVGFNDFPSLRRLMWCGEVFPTPALAHWMRRLPHVAFTNLYGPTEATVASSYYTIPACPQDEAARIPIGQACEGEELLVLDERLEAVPRGKVANLYIRGVGLSPGYWRDPEKTRAAFLPAPGAVTPDDRIYRTGDLAYVGDDGLLYFNGRADSQIKSRGHRIELGEIEAALNAEPSIRECAVVAVGTDGFEGAVICCAYAPMHGADATPSGLNAQLRKVLPGYMVPSRWRSYDKLPQNANGKIDRPRLVADFASVAADRHPSAHSPGVGLAERQRQLPVA